MLFISGTPILTSLNCRFHPEYGTIHCELCGFSQPSNRLYAHCTAGEKQPPDPRAPAIPKGTTGGVVRRIVPHRKIKFSRSLGKNEDLREANLPEAIREEVQQALEERGMDFVKIPGTQTLYVRDEAEWLAETVVSLRPPPHKRPLDGLPEFHGWMCTLCPDWSTAFCALNWDFSPHLASHHPQGKRGQNVEPVRMQSFGYGQHALWFAVPSSVWSPLSITFISRALPPP